MASAPGGPALPEVDEVDEGLGALAAHEARRVPLPGVARPVSVHHRAVPWYRLLAGLAALQQRGSGVSMGLGTRQAGAKQPCSVHGMDVYFLDILIHGIFSMHCS